MSTRNTSTFQTSLLGTCCDPGTEPTSTPHLKHSPGTRLRHHSARPRPGQDGHGDAHTSSGPSLKAGAPSPVEPSPAVTTKQESLPARPPLASGGTKGSAVPSVAWESSLVQTGQGEATNTRGHSRDRRDCVSMTLKLKGQGPGRTSQLPARGPSSLRAAWRPPRARPRTFLQATPSLPVSPSPWGHARASPPVFLSLALYTTP